MEKYKTSRKNVSNDSKYGLRSLFMDCVLIVGAIASLPLIFWAKSASDKQRIERTEKWNAENVPGWAEAHMEKE